MIVPSGPLKGFEKSKPFSFKNVFKMYYVYIIDFRLGGSGGKLAISNLETTNV